MSSGQNFNALDEDVRERRFWRCLLILEEFGPRLGRPHVDTLKDRVTRI